MPPLLSSALAGVDHFSRAQGAHVRKGFLPSVNAARGTQVVDHFSRADPGSFLASAEAARVYYGVNSEEAVALRVLGVPRAAATPMAKALHVGPTEPLSTVRTKLRATPVGAWKTALGERGDSYHRVWSIIEGDA